jgi:hypothetical protein
MSSGASFRRVESSRHLGIAIVSMLREEDRSPRNDLRHDVDANRYKSMQSNIGFRRARSHSMARVHIPA